MHISDLVTTFHWHECYICGEQFNCPCSNQAGDELCDECEGGDDRSSQELFDDAIDNEIERLRLGE